jgi:signal transduction histidine kinase
VANSGRAVPPADLDRLSQPFQRLGTERTDHGDSVGLGPSIVQAIATAHQATVATTAQVAGGLTIEVSFPPIRGHPSDPPAEARSLPILPRALSLGTGERI